MATMDGDVDAVDITFDFGDSEQNGKQNIDLTFDLEIDGVEKTQAPEIQTDNEPSSVGPKLDADIKGGPKMSDGLTLDLLPPMITIQEPSPMVENRSPEDSLSEYKPAIVRTEVSTELENELPDQAVSISNNVNGDDRTQENKPNPDISSTNPDGGEQNEAKNDFDFDEGDLLAGVGKTSTNNEDDDEFDFDDGANKAVSKEKTIQTTTVVTEKTFPQPTKSNQEPTITISKMQEVKSDVIESQSSVIVERSANLGDVELSLGDSADHAASAVDSFSTSKTVTSEVHTKYSNTQIIESKTVTINSTSTNVNQPMIDGTRPKQIPGAQQLPPQPDVPSTKSNSVLAAEEEWGKVKEITPEMGTEDTIGIKRPADMGAAPLLSYRELLEFERNSDIIKKYKDQIQVTVPRKGFGAIIHSLFGSKLHKSLHNDRDLTFCLAACPFDNDEPIHCRALQTIYRRLTGSKFDCSRFGGHWEQIGFQGNDPATDLRGTGFLALFQLIYFLSDAKTISLAKEIYKLAQHETQNFPFCIMSINMTRIAVQCLRGDCLNKDCNKAKDLLNTFNDFYVATYYRLYTVWKSGHKTIADTGYVMKDLEALAKKNPKEILKGFEEYKARKQGGCGEVGTSGDGLQGTSAPTDELNITKFSEMEANL